MIILHLIINILFIIVVSRLTMHVIKDKYMLTKFEQVLILFILLFKVLIETFKLF